MEILYSKEGFTFTKVKPLHYSLSFHMQNNYMILSRIIDFHLIKLIYDLNNDIYENVNLHIINEEEATVNLLMKHLFADLGLPQRYSYLHMRKITNESSIQFISQTIKSEIPEGMPLDAELMPIQTMVCNCKILSPHKMLFTVDVQFEDTITIPAVAEKIVGLILHKIFNRVKQFIENVRM